MRLKTFLFEDCLEVVKMPPKLQKNKYLDKGNFPVVAQEDSTINGYTNDETLIFKINSPVIIFGDHTRKLKYIDFDFAVGADGVKIIKPKSDINVKFFFYYLTLMMPENIGYARHYKLLKKIKFNIPSLDEQESIVVKLDSAFAGIDNVLEATQHNLHNVESLFKSFLNFQINKDKKKYDVSTIKEICIIGDGNHSSKYPKKSEMTKSGIPFIRSTNIIDGKISDKKLIFISEKKHLELKKGHIKEGDILLTNRGAGIGELAFVDKRFNNSNLNSQIAWLRCKDVVVNRYLYYIFLSKNMQDIIMKLKTGTALPQLTITEINKIRIYLPPKKKQMELIEIFSSFEYLKKELISVFASKINNFKYLKNLMLREFLLKETQNEKA